MKKILSIVLALSMVFAMAIAANAAVSDSIMKFTSDVTEVTVGEEFTVTIKYVPGEGACFKGGSTKLEWDYTVASFVEEVEGMTDFSLNSGNINPDKNIYVIKHAMNADDANSWQALTEEAVFSVVKFRAEKVGTFTLSCGSSTVGFADADNVEKVTYKNQNMTPLSITIKDAVVEPEESVDTLTAKTDITIDGQKWTDIALYEASFNLNDIDVAKGYGIRVGETGKVTSTVAGTGTVDFVLAYYGDGAANVGTVQSFWTAK